MWCTYLLEFFEIAGLNCKAGETIINAYLSVQIMNLKLNYSDYLVDVLFSLSKLIWKRMNRAPICGVLLRDHQLHSDEIIQ